MEKLTEFESSYLESALWSSTDGNGAPLDSGEYADMECSDEMIARIKLDCESFISLVEPVCAGICTVGTQVAHDFWLTRNRHGAGFWDGDYPEPQGRQLTDIAHSFGECDIYVGDDNKFHIS